MLHFSIFQHLLLLFAFLGNFVSKAMVERDVGSVSSIHISKKLFADFE